MRKKAVVCVLLCLLLAGAGGGAYWYLHYGTGQGSQKERPPLPEGMEDTGQIVAATGTTSTGVVEKELDFNFLDADLIVDELYVSSSDTVEAGDKILKITENSLKEATRELERAKMDASLAYRQGKLDYQSGLLDAENSLKKSQIAAQSAQTVYDDAVAQAQASVLQLGLHRGEFVVERHHRALEPVQPRLARRASLVALGAIGLPRHRPGHVEHEHDVGADDVLRRGAHHAERQRLEAEQPHDRGRHGGGGAHAHRADFRPVNLGGEGVGLEGALREVEVEELRRLGLDRIVEHVALHDAAAGERAGVARLL